MNISNLIVLLILSPCLILGSPILSKNFQFQLFDGNSFKTLELPQDILSQIQLKADQRHLEIEIKEENEGPFININLENKEQEGELDYVDLGIPSNLPSDFDPNQQIRVSPEIAIVIDYDNYLFFGGDASRIAEYLAIYMAEVNNRFATMPDPAINFLITGFVAITDRSGQGFIENALNPATGIYSMSQVLDGFSIWVHNNKESMSPFDLAMILSDKPYGGTAGIAYLGATCWATSTRFYGVSVTSDAGGFWKSVRTAAHEIGHNFGALHDTPEDTPTCPATDGFIMSYQGHGSPNKFRFSRCSQEAMKTFLGTDRAICTYSHQAGDHWSPSPFLAGDKLSMTEQCIKVTGRSNAVVDHTKDPNFLCSNLVCRYPNDSGSGTIILTTNNAPGANSPCGTSNGRCVLGYCV